MTDNHALVADLFRHESGRLIALLLRRVGAQRLDAVEDAVQDALLAAMRSWPLRGIPANPQAWLFTAARNALTDRFKRARFELPEEFATEPSQQPDLAFAAEEALHDDLLNLIVYCCHPSLSHAAQLALTLRLACGLSVNEVAGALLAAPESIAQRIVRAKRELRELQVDAVLPPVRELVEQRLPAILQTIYLLFDAGYLSANHELWLRPALCEDALRLARILSAHPATAEHATHALAALLHLSAARLPARVGVDGWPVPLAQQDRSKWDQALIAAGFRYMDAAIGGDVVSRYHIEAAIAAEHASAGSVEATNWHEIVRLYDELCSLYPSPVASLNRIIAVRYAHGAAAALTEFAATDGLRSMDDSLIYHATLGELYRALGEQGRAADAFHAAANLAASTALADLFRGRERLARGH
ncbi:MAG TPA: DUF6596 domain-containing protein [Steroidobacteraceae bacterium]